MEVKSTDFLQHSVQIMAYHENGAHSLGIFKFDEFDNIPYNPSDTPTEIILDGTKYYYYDSWIRLPHEPDIWIRGIIPAEESMWSILSSHKYLLLLLPMLTALAFCGGYMLTGKFLRPVARINSTAEEIRRSGDLTKRIELPDTGDELYELSQTFNSMFESLEQTFESQKQFTSNASHELRTPVAIILAQCEYAVENASDKDELLEAIEAIQKQSYRMSHMIETLLIFSRIENHTDKYIRTDTNLTELLSSLCQDHSIISEKGITVSFECDENITYPVNKELFELMVNNLIRNGIRYGNENGFVKVRLERSDDKVIITVEDNGIGIAEEDMPHIWERFYRSDKSRSTKGLGLGLSLVREIAEYHNGTVSAKSTEGAGSTFYVAFNSASQRQ
ncbi:MAG: ATP-binding protein [Huintestinicola sp.]|uniref:HAMP domain-containing sensor histidine kinase n=1 Tax=Huintestinicola sp. TaxID=2981661 RepID=UPI003F0EB918